MSALTTAGTAKSGHQDEGENRTDRVEPGLLSYRLSDGKYRRQGKDEIAGDLRQYDGKRRMRLQRCRYIEMGRDDPGDT